MSRPSIELAGVSKAFGGGDGTEPVRVLERVDLAVAPGEIVAVAGRSGSGKTTMLALVSGFDAPDRGAVEVLGRPVDPAPPWDDLALVPQSLGLLDELTVAENVELPARLARRSAEAADVLEQLGVAHLARRHPDEVSLGEQQRVAVARAAATRPQVLLADEPISHQNEEWARMVMLVIERLADAGTACLLATHNAIAFESAHRILELHEGRLHPREAGRLVT